MSDRLHRRDFLARVWKWSTAAIGAAAVWTSWDVLRPPKLAEAGVVVKSLEVDEVSETEAVAVNAARAYLTKIDGEVVALSERCPHLRCRLDWCETSGQFECPCHGSTFNRAGEHRTGPADHGMDRFDVAVIEGVVHIDTSSRIEGPPLGQQTFDEPIRGPSCGHEA